MTLNEQGFYFCPRDEGNKAKTLSLMDAYQKLRCRDCVERKRCDGPVFKEAKADISPPRPRNKPKAQTPAPTPEESSVVADNPASGNEAACRAALLTLFSVNKNNKLLQKRAEEIVGKFQEEIATARSQGVGWKPIAKTLTEHGFTLGWNAAQKAFERIAPKN